MPKRRKITFASTPLSGAITIHFAEADLARLRAVRASTGASISFQVRAAVRAALDASHPLPAKGRP